MGSYKRNRSCSPISQRNLNNQGTKLITSLELSEAMRSEITPCLQANKLSSHSSMDIGRRHETPGLEVKDRLSLMTTVVAKGLAFFTGFLNLSSHGTMQRGPGIQVYLHMQWVVLQENSEFQETKAFTQRGNMLYIEGDIISILQG